MKVLSLFDGISCGQIALNRIGITDYTYYASEIDTHAISTTKRNYPQTIHIGDVSKVSYENGILTTENGSYDVGKIDLVIAGFCCQSFSFSGKMLNFEDPRGQLFFETNRILKEVNPTYFLLENVKMKQQFQSVISEHVGVDPILINSNLVSAQNRPRLYWTNIPGVEQPEDRGVLLSDILEDNVDENYYLTDKALEKLDIQRFANDGIRGVVFTERRTEEAKRIRREHQALYGRDFSPRRGKELVPRTDGKCNCLTTALTKEHIVLDNQGKFRKLTPTECEALQTVTLGHTINNSDTQRYKQLGNGWTVEIIAHIFTSLTF
jgi:DNA-cytosine methyltransferase